MGLPDADYFEAHAATIAGISGNIGRLVALDPDVVITQAAPDIWPVTDSTVYTEAFYEDLNFAEQAAQAAEATDILVCSDAARSIKTLRTICTMYDEVQKIDLAGDVDDSQLRSLSYQTARYAMATIGDGVQVERTQLIGLETHQTAEASSYSCSEQLVTTKLSFVRLGAAVIEMSYDVMPTEDEQSARWTAVMGEYFTDNKQLFLLLTGRYKTEADLDFELNEAWLTFQGTSKEQEIGPILDEIRDRAIATKDSAHLSSEFSLHLPSSDVLGTIADILAQK